MRSRRRLHLRRRHRPHHRRRLRRLPHHRHLHRHRRHLLLLLRTPRPMLPLRRRRDSMLFTGLDRLLATWNRCTHPSTCPACAAPHSQ
jgi:hypothetical protein